MSPGCGREGGATGTARPAKGRERVSATLRLERSQERSRRKLTLALGLWESTLGRTTKRIHAKDAETCTETDGSHLGPAGLLTRGGWKGNRDRSSSCCWTLELVGPWERRCETLLSVGGGATCCGLSRGAAYAEQVHLERDVHRDQDWVETG